MTRRLIPLAALALLFPLLFVATAHATPTCTTTISPGQKIQGPISNAGPNAVVCFTSGTFLPTNPIVLPGAMSVIGLGTPLDPSVIECATLTYCINATAGPSNVDLENLVLQNATKADLQIGSGTSSTPVTGWTISGITATGAGQVGITMNNVADVTLSGSTISNNGSVPYDTTQNPTGDFGFRAVRADSLTVEDNTFSDNVTIPTSPTGASTGFAGGAKFNTDSNFTVTGNTFTGNGGGGQLWIDIDATGFEVSHNTIDAAANATTGERPADALRVEVSCGGTIGPDNAVQAGTTAGIDLFDSSGIAVEQNQVSTTVPNSWGIRMYANTHPPVPGHGCDSPADVYKNINNTATGNTMTLTASATGWDGVFNDTGGTSSANAWTANTYFVRHCDGAGSLNWQWWDGSAQQKVSFPGWQAFGQDPGPAGTCTSTYPRIDSFDPVAGQIGAVVTIHGSGLAGTTAVRFHQIPATQFHVDSDAQITATVPAGATTGPICVTAPNPGGCTTASFTVQPPATVTGLSPSSGAAGTVVAIQGSALTGATGVTFTNGLSAAFTVVSDTEIDATAPAGVASGPVCVQMPVQGAVCAATPFTVLPPGAPTITSPSATFQLAPFAVSWGVVTGADSYQAQWRSAPYNKGYPAAWTTTSTTGTSLPAPTLPGQTTCFQVAALNTAGSATSGPTCTEMPLDDRGLTVSAGTWSMQAASRFYQGTATVSQKKNATLTLTGVSARAVALVVELQPGGGSVNVLLNGTLLSTVSTASTTKQDRQLINVASWKGLHTGTITLTLPAGGSPVVIDGIGLYRG